MITYAYARVSTREQGQEGYSLEAQQYDFNQYMDREGYGAIDPNNFRTETFSAKRSSQRKIFNQMIEDIKKVKGPVRLLAHKTDRLGRNFKDHILIQDLIDSEKIELHLIKEHKIITKNSHPSEKLTHGINIVMAQYYSDNLKEEVKKGMTQKARNGWLPGNVPFGYKNNKDTKEIDLVPEEACFVKRAYELCTVEKYSLALIRDTLYNEGVIYKPSTPKIHLASLHCMLTNKFYTGQFKLKDEIYPGKHIPLISIEDYKQAQELFKRTNRTKNTKQKNQFTYSGLLACADCGCSITAQIQKGKYVYYHCTNYRKVCKSQLYVKEERLTEQFAIAFKQIQVPEEYIPKIIDDLKNGHKEEIERHQQQVDTLNRQITMLKNRLNKLLDMHLDGEIAYETYIEKQNKIQDDTAHLESLLSSYKNANFDFVDKAARILNLAKGAHDLFLSQSPEERRKFINMTLLNCKLDGKNLSYEYHQPFDMFYKMADSKEWWPITELNCGHKDFQPLSSMISGVSKIYKQFEWAM